MLTIAPIGAFIVAAFVFARCKISKYDPFLGTLVGGASTGFAESEGLREGLDATAVGFVFVENAVALVVVELMLFLEVSPTLPGLTSSSSALRFRVVVGFGLLAEDTSFDRAELILLAVEDCCDPIDAEEAPVSIESLLVASSSLIEVTHLCALSLSGLGVSYLMVRDFLSVEPGKL